MPRSLKTKLTLAALIAAGALAASAPAHAACCVAYDYQDAANNKNQVISQLTDRINAMQLAVLEGLRLGTGQLSGNLKETIGANSNTANVQDDRSVTGRVETARLAAITSSASGASSCNVITGANAGTKLGSAVKAFTMTGTHDMASWDAGSDTALPSSKGLAAAVEARIANHCATYSTQADVTSGLCTSVGSMQLANQDVGSSIYYSPSSSDAETLDDAHMAAAKAFMVNAVDPAPHGPLLPGEGKQPGAHLLEGERQAAAARASVASQTFMDTIARRAPLSGTDAAQWAQAMASQTNMPTPAGSNGQISQYDWMQTRARGWFFNPNWAVAADTQNEAQAVKDLTMMTSWMAYVQFENFKLQERNNLLLATLVAIQNQNTRGSQNTAAR